LTFCAAGQAFAVADGARRYAGYAWHLLDDVVHRFREVDDGRMSAATLFSDGCHSKIPSFSSINLE
jgi:hypothetical protein